MSPDESLVTIAAVVIGPVLWAVWLFRLSRVQTLRPMRLAEFSERLALSTKRGTRAVDAAIFLRECERGLA